MGKTIHLCQSVEGALRNWGKAEWESVSKSNNMSIDELKDVFFNYLREGKVVIPLGEPCEGFDYKTGCPGHETGPQTKGEQGR